MTRIADALVQLFFAMLVGVVLAVGLPVYSVISLMRRGIEPPVGIFEWAIVVCAGTVLAVIWVTWVVLMWILSVGLIRSALTRLVGELNTARTRQDAHRGQNRVPQRSRWYQENPTVPRAGRLAGIVNTTGTAPMTRGLIVIARNLRTFAIYVLVIGTGVFLYRDRSELTYWDALVFTTYFLGFAVLVLLALWWIGLVVTQGPIAGTKQFAAEWMRKEGREDDERW